MRYRNDRDHDWLVIDSASPLTYSLAPNEWDTRRLLDDDYVITTRGPRTFAKFKDALGHPFHDGVLQLANGDSTNLSAAIITGVAAGTRIKQIRLFSGPTTAPGTNLEFLRYWVGQSANATSAQQRIEIDTQLSSWPTAMTSATVNKLKAQDAASSITGASSPALGQAGITASGTQVEGGGAKSIVWNDAFNVLNGWLHVPTPAETRIIPASFAQGQGLFFASAPGTATGWAAGICFREV